MSAIWTLDVRCDGEGCVEWANGCDSHTLTEARKLLNPQGWSTKREGGKMYDLCPACTESSNGIRVVRETGLAKALDSSALVPIRDLNIEPGPFRYRGGQS